jgi:meso-butanediol dehydrogenase/(S,S)-butanediol dehydrogenase/diacetyl reductase
MWDYNDRVLGQMLGEYGPGELMAEWVEDIPMGRAGTLAEVAALVNFLPPPTRLTSPARPSMLMAI